MHKVGGDIKEDADGEMNDEHASHFEYARLD